MTKEKTQFERLMTKDFSPSVAQTFGILQSHFEIESMNKTVIPSNITKGILLRGLMRGLVILHSGNGKQENRIQILKKKNGGEGNLNGASLTEKSTGERGNLHFFRLPSPSVTALAKRIPYQHLKRVKGKHLLILKYDMEGKWSRKEIASLVGCSEPTVTNTLNSPAIQEMKGRAFQNIEDSYSALLFPAVAAIRDGMKGNNLELRVKTAFSYLKSKGRGSQEIQHKHKHEHTGQVEVEVSQIKERLLQKVGIKPQEAIEASFSKVD